jgi:hypothetical protein
VYRIQLTILLLSFSIFAWAQDVETDDPATPAEESTVDEETEVTDEDIDELLGIGEEDYTDSEDDDFDPTESVRYEQSIPFPVDI